jgi:cell division protease FtsH
VTPAIRTVLFWVMMIALATVLWKMANEGKDESPSRQMSYSDFMGQVDQGNIATAKLLLSPSTAEVQGTLRQGSERFTVTIPTEVIPDLTERLRKQGTTVEVAETKNSNVSNTIINFSPIIIIIGIWIFMMRRMQNRKNPPPQGGPTSGALG